MFLRYYLLIIQNILTAVLIMEIVLILQANMGILQTWFTLLNVVFRPVPILFAWEPMWYAFPRKERGNEKAKTVKTANYF